jgi:hypothetical protein
MQYPPTFIEPAMLALNFPDLCQNDLSVKNFGSAVLYDTS